jgi:hypothetical protein
VNIDHAAIEPPFIEIIGVAVLDNIYDGWGEVSKVSKSTPVQGARPLNPDAINFSPTSDPYLQTQKRPES